MLHGARRAAGATFPAVVAASLRRRNSGFDDSQFLNVDGILSTKDPADIPLIVTIITIIIALPLFCCATCCLYRNAMKEAEKDAVEQARRRAYIGV